jgi:hypothetical protein
MSIVVRPALDRIEPSNRLIARSSQTTGVRDVEGLEWTDPGLNPLDPGRGVNWLRSIGVASDRESAAGFMMID